jgi:hypothetical protein
VALSNTTYAGKGIHMLNNKDKFSNRDREGSTADYWTMNEYE